MPQKGKVSSSLAYCVCLNCALGPSCVLMQLSLDFPVTPYKVNIFPHGFLKFLREISGQPQGGRGGRAGDKKQTAQLFYVFLRCLPDTETPHV